jgi:hypothetical protein
VIWLARCSALVRDRPVVVMMMMMMMMTLRLPRRRRTSHACPGGRPRELVEPVSILDGDGWHGWSLPVGLDWAGASAGLLGVTDKTGTGRSGWRASSYEVTWPADRA